MIKSEKIYLYECIGERIKELRQKSGFSQEVLGKKLELSRASVVNIEKGRQQPSIHLIIDISRILNVDINQILDMEILDSFTEKNRLRKLEKKIAESIGVKKPKEIMNFISGIKK